MFLLDNLVESIQRYLSDRHASAISLQSIDSTSIATTSTATSALTTTSTTTTNTSTTSTNTTGSTSTSALTGKRRLSDGAAHIVPWPWVASRVLDVFLQYPAGLTRTILFAELESKWDAEKMMMGNTKSRRSNRVGFSNLSALKDEVMTCKEKNFEAFLLGVKPLIRQDGKEHTTLNVLALTDIEESPLFASRRHQHGRHQILLHRRF
ncbi:hypothetical protein BC829DRAFT_391828 [Chytridium lagenaria]|nr:hypothetical protein BC829DRAFT_391828 [Chytridium lagenaria]